MKKFLLLISLFSLNTYALTEEELISKISNEKSVHPHYDVGVAFLSGVDIEINLEKALFWLAQSSEIEQNDKADYLIADMYAKGKTPSKIIDMNKAVFFYERAAKRGNEDAMLKLSVYSFFNEQVLDRERGLHWLNELKLKKHQTGTLLYTLLTYSNEDSLSISKQINYLELMSDLGDKNASFSLGYFYFSGKGVERDLNKAKAYFFKSMATGNIISDIFILQIDKLA